MLPTIVIAGNWACVSHVTNLKDLQMYMARIAQAFCDFQFIASFFDVLNQADFSVDVCFHTSCLLSSGFTPTSNGCACLVNLNHGWHVQRAFMVLAMICFMLAPAM